MEYFVQQQTVFDYNNCNRFSFYLYLFQLKQIDGARNTSNGNESKEFLIIAGDFIDTQTSTATNDPRFHPIHVIALIKGGEIL